jgi:hypothetical protein
MSRRDAREQTATSLAVEQFHQVLSRIIESVQDDPARLRKVIYELARARLLREGWLKNPPAGILEMRRCLHALDLAIERVENLSAEEDELRALLSRNRLIANAGSADSTPNQAVITIDCGPFGPPLDRSLPVPSNPISRLPPMPVANGIWSAAAPLSLGAATIASLRHCT